MSLHCSVLQLKLVLFATILLTIGTLEQADGEILLFGLHTDNYNSVDIGQHDMSTIGNNSRPAEDRALIILSSD